MWVEHDIKLPLAPQRNGRIDLIRGIAVLGMIFVNTRYLFAAQSDGEDWLTFLSSLLDGRPAAIFIVLSGIGVSLMVNRCKSGIDLKVCRVKLLKRAAVLFSFGLVLLSYWTADILHFYGMRRANIIASANIHS